MFGNNIFTGEKLLIVDFIVDNRCKFCDINTDIPPTHRFARFDNTKLNLIEQYPLIALLLCAQLACILTKSSDITTIVRNRKQRTKKENSAIENGLIRSLVLEFFIFVPASAIIIRLAVLPFVIDRLLEIHNSPVAWYSLMGIVAYVCPFALIRRIVIKIALNTLQEFQQILTRENTGNEKTEYYSDNDELMEKKSDNDV